MRRTYLAIPASVLALVAMAACGSDGGTTVKPEPSKPDASAPQDSGTDARTTPDAVSDAGADANVDAADAADAAPHAAGWDLDYALPGLSGPPTSIASAIAVFGNRQIAVAGEFDYAGSVPARNVAVWNGNAWLALGAGLPKPASALAATPTGELFAVVSWDDASTLWKWNKTAWVEIAVTTEGRIASIDVSANGTLFAAGSFTTIGGQALPRGAKLVGTTWSAIAPSQPDGWVDVIRAIGTGACIGGGIDDTSFGVSCTDGITWSARKGNLNRGAVHALADMNGTLVAAGEFSLVGAGFDDGGSLAKWTGTTWELIGGGLNGTVGGPGNVQALTVSGTKVYVTGRFPLAGGTYVRNIALFDTASKKWSDMNGGLVKAYGISGIDMPVGFALAADPGGEVYVGGTLTLAGGRNALNIARWDGSALNPVDDPNATRLGMNGVANAIVTAGDGSVYVGGPFSFVGGDVAANHVARLSGKTWSSLGSGIDGDVSGLAVKGSDIFAVGSFDGSGSVTARNIARWNGATWTAVGGGLDGPGRVAITGPDGRLYVGGGFTTAGTTIVNRIAAWDGQAWSAFGEGVDGEVRAIGFDAAGKMFVGGTFTKAGTVAANRVATWDGAAWKALGDGVDESVDSLVVFDGKVTIGGTFEKSGAVAVPHLAAWSGTAWIPVGGGLMSRTTGPTYVQGLAVAGNALYATGLIEKAGTLEVSHIARWDGAAWSALEGGINDVGEDLFATNDSLWVTGTFSSAGGRGSVGIGRYWLTR